MTDFIKDRDGAGNAIGRKLVDAIGGDTSSFRTRIIDDGITKTMLRTKGGAPELTVKKKPIAVCELFPLVEKTLTGNLTQADRLYYHDNQADINTPARRKFSYDGVLSLLVTPLMRLRLHSQGLGKYVTVWFNDHTKATGETDADLVQVGVSTSTEFSVAVTGVKAVEQLRNTNDPPELLRTYYKPVFVSHQDAVTPSSDLKSMGFLFKRIKHMSLDTSLGAFGIEFGNFDTENPPLRDVSTAASLPTGASENLGGRTFYGTDPWPKHNVKKLAFTAGDLTVAAPGGVLEPLVRDVLDVLDPQQYTYSDKVRPLTSISELQGFGKPWHGYLEDQNNGAGPRVLWDSIERNTQLRVHNSLPENGPIVDLIPYVYNGYDRYYNFGMPEVDTLGAVIPGKAGFKNHAIINSGRLGCFADSPVILPTQTAAASDLLYKDPDGTVWKLSIAQTAGFYITVTVTGRVDDFMDEKVICSVEIARFFTAGTSTFYKMVVKNSPDGKKAALILYTGATAAEMLVSGVDGYYLLGFSGTGSVDEATYGEGISCSYSGVMGWEVDGGPLGRIYKTETTGGATSASSTVQPSYVANNVPISDVTVGVYPNQITTRVYEDAVVCTQPSYSRYEIEVVATLHDIAFNRETNQWDRIDVLRETELQINNDSYGFLGKVTRTSVTDFFGVTTTYSPSHADTYVARSTVTTRTWRLSTQEKDQGITGKHSINDVVRWSLDNNTFDGPISDSVSVVDSGVPSSASTVLSEVGSVIVGYPYIGRYLSATFSSTTVTSKVCYERAVSDFQGSANMRIAYDPVNETIHEITSPTYGYFV